MADARVVCPAIGAAPRRHLSWSAGRRHHLHFPRFWNVQLPGGLLSATMLLAGRVATVEPFQQLWPALPGAVEHAYPLPLLAHLSAAAFDLVVVVLLPGASILGRAGDVFPGPELDQSPACRRAGGGDFLLQRLVTQFPHVAEPRGNFQLAALGGVAGTTGLAGGWQGAGMGDGRRRNADAGGRA